MAKTFIISLGGSLINPGEINFDLLKKLRLLILKSTKRGNHFVLMTGGGSPARNYQNALKKIAKPTTEDLDWMGIQATWLNAKLVQLMFGRLAHLRLVSDPNQRVKSEANILVAGGWLPGRSTDDDAVRLAKTYGAKMVINLSNIDYVYDKDPSKFKNARKIRKISWQDFRKIVGNKWRAGANFPFDPTASRFAQKHKLEVIVANGKNLKNLENILTGKTYKGTVIK